MLRGWRPAARLFGARAVEAKRFRRTVGIAWGVSAARDDGAYMALAACVAACLSASFAACEDGLDAAERLKRAAPLHRNYIADAAEKALPAVVNITSQFSQSYFGVVRTGRSAGSGFIVREDGLVVTNAHVVAHGLARIIVTLHDGRKFRASVVASDAQSDVALLQLEAAKDLRIAKIGSSSRLRPGDFVLALGSPLNLPNSVTFGIVSAVARHGSEIGIVTRRSEYIQTDAAINVGNSGGPLVDLDGQVIGINTMKAVRADGISFAIPIDTAWQVVRRLVKHGRVARPFIGIKMMASSAGKVVVVEVMPGSPAEKADLQPGDAVVEFNGLPVKDVPDVLAQIGFDDRQRIPIKVDRGGYVLDMEIVSESAPRAE
ncbi:trypsin-like cysteine/serine peptidase domain-containing protein [Pelagophyceae sp. CCMP2097]|nr:trypsin-like cysteine/serine peptidase domain-containing protein [Pelagophyceae sp. CCMP2097]